MAIRIVESEFGRSFTLDHVYFDHMPEFATTAWRLLIWREGDLDLVLGLDFHPADGYLQDVLNFVVERMGEFPINRYEVCYVYHRRGQ